MDWEGSAIIVTPSVDSNHSIIDNLEVLHDPSVNSVPGSSYSLEIKFKTLCFVQEVHFWVFIHELDSLSSIKPMRKFSGNSSCFMRVVLFHAK